MYGGPGFLAAPLPIWPLSKLDWRHIRRPRKRDNLLTREGGGWRRGLNQTRARKPGSPEIIQYSQLSTNSPSHSQVQLIGKYQLNRHSTEYFLWNRYEIRMRELL
jgi:hypothetical protein